MDKTRIIGQLKVPLEWLVMFAVICFCTSCYYDVEEDFITDSTCDVSTVTYSDQILEILSNRCYKCHSAALNLGNITLEGYDRLRVQVDNGRLLGAIRRENGFSPMPQNEAMLSQCDIDLLATWVAEGAQNN